VPKQRNFAFTFDELIDIGVRERNLVTTVLFPAFGLTGKDQLRALVCDGPSLLAWIGGWRSERFMKRDKQMLQDLVPALRRRLTLERHLGSATVSLASLGRLLEAVSRAAFVVDRRGGVLHANTVGRAELDGSRHVVADGLRASVRGSGPELPFEMVPLAGKGAPPYYLAIRRAAHATPAVRVRAAASVWNLTKRQTEVLMLMAQGHPNKTIAAMLRCAENTVEFHVTEILRRSQAGSRAAVVSAILGSF
jgi:DNA-binding CsgD family transcriptional regulator